MSACGVQELFTFTQYQCHIHEHAQAHMNLFEGRVKVQSVSVLYHIDVIVAVVKMFTFNEISK